MDGLRDISEMEDIRRLVNTFYTEVRNDELLGPVFDRVIQDRWPAHIDRMITFWEAVLLAGDRYFGRPFAPHASLPVNRSHFDRWLRLFDKTIDSCFQGEKAEEAKWRASKMAVLFLSKIEYYQAHPDKLSL